MKRIKTILLLLVLLFITIQFIQPARNRNSEVLSTDIEKRYPVPVNISGILKNSCYDCHSNNTNYPWYSSIQPGAWWMASHIKKGKANLNFSGFGNYSNRKQQNKLQSIINSITDGTMPLPYYTMMHKDAILSNTDKDTLLNWLKATKDSLELKN